MTSRMHWVPRPRLRCRPGLLVPPQRPLPQGLRQRGPRVRGYRLRPGRPCSIRGLRRQLPVLLVPRMLRRRWLPQRSLARQRDRGCLRRARRRGLPWLRARRPRCILRREVIRRRILRQGFILRPSPQHTLRRRIPLARILPQARIPQPRGILRRGQCRGWVRLPCRGLVRGRGHRRRWLLFLMPTRRCRSQVPLPSWRLTRRPLEPARGLRR